MKVEDFIHQLRDHLYDEAAVIAELCRGRVDDATIIDFENLGEVAWRVTLRAQGRNFCVRGAISQADIRELVDPQSWLTGIGTRMAHDLLNGLLAAQVKERGDT